MKLRLFLFEDVYGKAAMNIVVYHRTYDIDTVYSIKDHGFVFGGGSMYGNGIYATCDLQSQLNRKMNSSYGEYIIKSVVSLNHVLICIQQYAKRLYGKNFNIEDQLKTFGIRYDKGFKYTIKDPDVAKYISKNQDIVSQLRGLLFSDKDNGKAVVMYDTSAITPMSYNSTITDARKLDSEDWISITNKRVISKHVDSKLYSFLGSKA